MNSDTPRTDTLEEMGCLTPAFLRQLERELEAANQDAERLAGELLRLCKEVRWFLEDKRHPVFEAYLKWGETAIATHETRIKKPCLQQTAKP